MASLSDFENLFRTLSPGEKAQILKWVVGELGGAFSGIDYRPYVSGGEPCIVRTRIPVWLLEQARQMGASEQELPAVYPSLRGEDLVKRLGVHACAGRGDRGTNPGERCRLVARFYSIQTKHRPAGGDGAPARGT